MIEKTLAHPAHQSTPEEHARCFRHEGEDCPRCDGLGFKPRRYCEICSESSGSISQGTGFPLVKDRRTGGLWFHVNCQPKTGGAEALLADLERMGG